MADAIESRRRERRLSPSAFAIAAGVTPQGLAPVRRGERRNYQEKILTGVAAALWWPLDWYERLKAGESDLPTVRPAKEPEAALSIEERITRLERILEERLGGH
jgi:transcriptional regulator with XRE-family HTH domain